MIRHSNPRICTVGNHEVCGTHELDDGLTFICDICLTSAVYREIARVNARDANKRELSGKIRPLTAQSHVESWSAQAAGIVVLCDGALPRRAMPEDTTERVTVVSKKVQH